MERKIYMIAPVPAPRQIRSDKWNPRPSVLRYRAFRDAVKYAGVKLPDAPCKITFFIEMPASWSKKRRASAHGTPHTGSPDIDNLGKAVLDAIFRDRDGEKDSHVWSVWFEKRWSNMAGFCVERIDGGWE